MLQLARAAAQPFPLLNYVLWNRWSILMLVLNYDPFLARITLQLTRALCRNMACCCVFHCRSCTDHSVLKVTLHNPWLHNINITIMLIPVFVYDRWFVVRYSVNVIPTWYRGLMLLHSELQEYLLNEIYNHLFKKKWCIFIQNQTSSKYINLGLKICHVT